MDEKYRLTFRGELLDGQHGAVVKRRLSDLLKLKDGQIEKLFPGRPVVVKRAVDRETAVRYQALFKKAGCRLRVTAESPPAGSAVPDEGQSGSAKPETTPARDSDSDQPSKSPASSTIKAPEFEVQSTWFPPPEGPRPEIEAPDYSVAEVGSVLISTEEADDGDGTPGATAADVDFGLAEVGADLLTERKEVPPVELGSLDFEVAEVGADIGAPSQSEATPAPDISHLAIVEPESR